MSPSLTDRMRDEEFAGYAYAYPHKTSYRPLEPPVPLEMAWEAENKDSLFLYVHLPFCEMRCGFCNLFTSVQPHQSFVSQTLAAIGRQSRKVAETIQPRHVSQLAFGGGTPSFLSVRELEQLFQELSATWSLDWSSARASFEVSPATIDREKLALLKEFGVDRISMGVQSFSPEDLKQLGRPQSASQVQDAIEKIQSAEFPIFNLDLIYGMQGQDMGTWNQTIERTIDIRPEEIYLYPLYVRAETGLAKTGKSPSQQRRELYVHARNALLTAGYRQISMRLFRRVNVECDSDYCCQDDGMIGLGPGARSYTQSLHYSSEYAVGQTGVRQIIAEFNSRSDEQFAVADYGVYLDQEEQCRRYVIKSLLRIEGLDLLAYEHRFASQAEVDFPQLAELVDLEMAAWQGQSLRLTAKGLSWSDVIGPWLYSEAVIARMEAYELA